MLYNVPKSLFPLTYAQKGLWLQTSFYTLSICQELIWELNKTVRSIPCACPSRAGHLLPGGAGNCVRTSAELLPLLLRLLPPPTCTQINLKPHKCHVPARCQLLCRPKTATKTSSWLSESQTITSHAL